MKEGVNLTEQQVSALPPTHGPSKVWKYAFLALMVIVVIFAGFVVLGVSTASYSGSSISDDVDRPTQGFVGAPITIIEYGDFQCPFCARATQSFKEAMVPYADRIHIEYRHFPLYQIHRRAVPSAVASECAQDQDKFWEYHDELYKNQANLEDKDLLRYARTIGLDVGVFWDCFTSQHHLAKVNRDYEQGVDDGVRSTPTFFINGKRFQGALDRDQWNSIFSHLTTGG